MNLDLTPPCNPSLYSALILNNIPSSLAFRTCTLLNTTVPNILMYGSRARGDHLDSSDLDLLVLSRHMQPAIHEGQISISFYTEEQLLTGISSLFGAHLQRDAIILRDDHGLLARIISTLGPPDTVRILRRVKHFSTIFTTAHNDVPKYISGLTRQAKYLLRSALYAIAIAEGRECYSVRGLAEYYGEPELSTLLDSRSHQLPLHKAYHTCLTMLSEHIGLFPKNRHGSLESLIVNEWYNDQELASFGLLALGANATDLDYCAVRKVLL